jgi:hypothetical protein
MHMPAMPRKWILGSVAVAATLIILLWVYQESSQISYHVHALQWAQQDVAKPDSFPRYFTRGFRWLLQTRRSTKEREESARFHREALVKLRHFERRQFTVDRDLSTEADANKKFCAMRGRLPLSCSLWQLQFDPTPSNTTVTICSSAADMKLWEKLFAEFDEKGHRTK